MAEIREAETKPGGRLFPAVPEREPIPWDYVTWLGLMALFLLWASLFAATWGHWGDLTIDCGREMYVPAELARGRTLYTDVWYPYTPFAPYLNSLFFRVFGVHLAVLYWAGALAALGSAMLLYMTGLLVTSRIAAWTVGCIVLIEAFVSGGFGFPLPYSFGAVYGCLAACLCLWFAVKSCSGRWLGWTSGAGMAAALAFLAKPEIGAGCFAALVLLAVIRISQEGGKGSAVRQAGMSLVTLLPGILACLAVAGWMISLRGSQFLIQENLMSWPGSYFMKTYGARWLASTGLAFSAKSLLRIALLTATLAIWYGFRWLRRREEARGQSAALAALVALLCLGVFAVTGFSQVASSGMSLFFPHAAAFLVALAVPVAALAALRGRRSAGFLRITVLFALAVAIALRNLFATLPHGYSVFNNGPILLSLFVIMGWFVFGPDTGRTGLTGILPYAAVVIAVLADVAPLYQRDFTLVPLITPRGVFYDGADKVLAYQTALAFVQQAKEQGDTVMTVPEDTSLYFLADIECPTRIYQFGPGVLAPGNMTNGEIADIERSNVRYLIWSNRVFPEYGAPVFGTDFDPALGIYFRSHFHPVKTIGASRGWHAVIWERSAARPAQ